MVARVCAIAVVVLLTSLALRAEDWGVSRDGMAPQGQQVAPRDRRSNGDDFANPAVENSFPGSSLAPWITPNYEAVDLDRIDLAEPSVPNTDIYADQLPEAGMSSSGNRQDMNPLGGLSGQGDRAPVRLRLEWLPERDLKGLDGRLSINSQALSLAFPLRFDADGRGLWLGLVGVRSLEVDTDTPLPDSGRQFPERFWDIDFGVMRLRSWEDGRRAGGMVRVGSPSDRPFAAWRDMAVTFLVFASIPSGERNAWSVSLFYSPTGQIVFPLPGLAYVWRPSPQFEASLGVPFALTYQPSDSLTIQASYRPLNQVRVAARQRLGELWSITTSYETVNDAFWSSDRDNDRERTYFFDQRLTLGLRRDLPGGWHCEASAFYVFDRKVFQAERFSRDRLDLLPIENGMGAALQIVWTR